MLEECIASAIVENYMTKGILPRIEAYNRGRDPERLALKYKKMISGPLAFYRGTSHIFYEDFPDERWLRAEPHVWLCGDLHIENFGTYRAGNRLTYFDWNDFDEACRGPAVWDLLRLLAGIAIEAQARSKPPLPWCRRFLQSYEAELRTGKPQWVERETSSGVIRELFDGLAARTPREFLDSRTTVKDRKRRLNTESGKALPIATGEERDRVDAFVQRVTGLDCLDAARRIAGNASLGVSRYVILAQGENDRHFLLDMKLAQKAAPLRYQSAVRQPRWKNEAERVVAAQRLITAIPPAFLRAVEFEGHGWILRELLPSEDRVEIGNLSNREFEEYIGTLGSLVAWGQLRASGHKGAAVPDELMTAAVPAKRLIEYALDYSPLVKRDWAAFRAAYDDANSPAPSRPPRARRALASNPRE